MEIKISVDYRRHRVKREGCGLVGGAVRLQAGLHTHRDRLV